MDASAAISVEEDQRLRDIQRQYVEMLDDGDASRGHDPVFAPVIEHVLKKFSQVTSNSSSDVTPSCIRVILNINDIRSQNIERCRSLLAGNASDELLALQRAFKEFVSSTDSDLVKNHPHLDFLVGIEGSLGPRHHVTPRTLTSSSLNNMVCVEGIVTTASLVKPKVAHSVHFCPTTAKTIERTYSDLTSLSAFPTTSAYPTQDEDGNALQTEYGLSNYRDHQMVTLQELPEKAPTGQLPRSVDIVCEDDLVDKVKPGDRIQIVGCYRCLPSKQGSGFTSGTFRTVLIANNVISAAERESIKVYADDVKACKRLAKSVPDVFTLIAKSLAPSISGHEYVKKALLCQLLGGVEKVLPSGTRLRGDINILLIGDPSVAKSQMLRYALAVAPRAVTTTGRGSSGVGLTAAVTTDQETGDRRLEAGAMVLADRGIVCIDEFDKMSDIDRTAIHEVMEQGRVSISKAGIHASLNARCSVLAAANPVYGRYDAFKTPMENIGLQDSLLSRFDLTFILLDTIDVDLDSKIAQHVVRTHRYRNPREADGAVTVVNTALNDLSTRNNNQNSMDEEGGSSSSSNKKAVIWDKFNPLLHELDRIGSGITGSSANNNSTQQRLLCVEFIRKYIHIAKHISPILTDEACTLIGEEYAKLRSHDFEVNSDSGGAQIARTQPVTARALETLIRLSTAHAKARLSYTVTERDANVAIELAQFAYFKTVLDNGKRNKNKQKKSNQKGDAMNSEGEEDDDNSTEESDMEEQCVLEEHENVEKAQHKKKRPVGSTYDLDDSIHKASDENVDAKKFKTDTLERFKSELSKMFELRQQQQIDMKSVYSEIEESLNLDITQVDKCIEVMTEDNKVMSAAGILYLI